MAAYNSRLRHPRGSCHCHISGIQHIRSGHRSHPLLHHKSLLSHCCSNHHCQSFSRFYQILDCTVNLNFLLDSFWDYGWHPPPSPWTSFAEWGRTSGWGRAPRSSHTFSPLVQLCSSGSEICAYHEAHKYGKQLFVFDKSPLADYLTEITAVPSIVDWSIQILSVSVTVRQVTIS